MNIFKSKSVIKCRLFYILMYSVFIFSVPLKAEFLTADSVFLILQDISRFVDVYPQGTNLYHYTRLEKVVGVDLTTISNSTPIALEYLGGKLRQGGIYTALDPVASRAWGGEKSWILFRFKLPSDSRVLKNFRALKLSYSAQNLFRSAGCKEIDKGLLHQYEGHCAEVLADFFKKAQVIGFSDGFHSSAFTNCNSRLKVSVVLNSLLNIPVENISVMTQENQTRDQEEDIERAAIQNLFKDPLATSYSSNSVGSKPAIFPIQWSNSQKLSPQEMNEWKSSHLKNCIN